MQCPPGLSPKQVSLIPRADREDALQEAWVAYLEAKQRAGFYDADTEEVVEVFAETQAARAAWRYCQQERRNRQRIAPVDVGCLCPDDIRAKW